MFSVRKRSGSNKMFFCSESEATATKCFSVAKAKRQQQMFSVATATNVFCAKAKRQQQMLR